MSCPILYYSNLFFTIHFYGLGQQISRTSLCGSILLPPNPLCTFTYSCNSNKFQAWYYFMRFTTPISQLFLVTREVWKKCLLLQWSYNISQRFLNIIIAISYWRSFDLFFLLFFLMNSLFKLLKFCFAFPL